LVLKPEKYKEYDDTTPREYIKDNYGDSAPDTWMEGDISWDEDRRFDVDVDLLSIVSVRAVN
jgi:hypothetical protein